MCKVRYIVYPWNIRIIYYFYSFVSRDINIVHIAEELCLRTNDCLTIIKNKRASNSTLNLTKNHLNQINILLLPSVEHSKRIYLVCPNCVAKNEQIVNIWNTGNKSLLYTVTQTACCNPLAGK